MNALVALYVAMYGVGTNEPTEPRLTMCPAVLVCHEAFGLDHHAKGRAERLAEELGVMAFALDYCGDGKTIRVEELAAKMGPLVASPKTSHR